MDQNPLTVALAALGAVAGIAVAVTATVAAVKEAHSDIHEADRRRTRQTRDEQGSGAKR